MSLGKTILAAVLLAVSIAARAAEPPFRFDSPSFDWGTVREADGHVSHTFVFTNVSGAPACIYSVNVSCGCTGTEWSRETVAPGARSSITVTFNPDGYRGRVSKTVSVLNSGKTTDVLTVSCNVVPAERPVEVAFPVLADCGLRLSSDRLQFGQIRQGRSVTKKFGIANVSGRRMTVTAVAEGGDGLLSAGGPLVLEPGARDSLAVTFSLRGRGKHFGVVEGAVLLRTDRGGNCGRVSVSMIGTDPAPAPGQTGGAKLRVSSQYENYGKVSRRGGPVSRDFVLSNIGDAPLTIRDVHTPPCIAPIRLPKTVLAPGEKITVTVTLLPELAEKQKVFETVHVTADDAEHPVREIMIAATIM